MKLLEHLNIVKGHYWSLYMTDHIGKVQQVMYERFTDRARKVMVLAN